MRSEPLTAGQSAAALVLALLIAAALLFSRLEVIPGLHGDEAWVGIRAYAIAHGARPMTGMNDYTGPFYDYLMAPMLGALGYSVLALRLFTGVACLATVVLYHRVVGRIFGPMTAAFATLTLVSLPFFSAFGRLAGENFALNPLLAVGAVALLLETGGGGRSAHPSPTRRASVALAFASGVCMGLGTWNHMIFASVVVAVAAAALYRHGTSLVRRPAAWAVCLGYGAALAPQVLVHLRLAPDQPIALSRAVASSLAGGFVGGLLRRLAEWPGLFVRIAHGDILFQRFAGEVALATPNLTAILFALGLAALWGIHKRDARPRTDAMQALVFGVCLFLTTLVICPGNADRYFLLPLYLVPLCVGAAFSAAARSLAGRSGLVVGLAGLSGVFGLFLCVQVGRIALDYFASQARSHGRASLLLLGSQPETSDHYVRTDGLYRQLVSIGARHLIAEFFIAEPLQFYDLESRQFSSISVADPSQGRVAPATYAVFYSGGGRRSLPEQYPGFQVVFEDAQFVVTRAMVPEGLRGQ